MCRGIMVFCFVGGIVIVCLVDVISSSGLVLCGPSGSAAAGLLPAAAIAITVAIAVVNIDIVLILVVVCGVIGAAGAVTGLLVLPLLGGRSGGVAFLLGSLLCTGLAGGPAAGTVFRLGVDRFCLLYVIVFHCVVPAASGHHHGHRYKDRCCCCHILSIHFSFLLL